MGGRMEPLSVVIIKPMNGACNMNCGYCYMNNLDVPQKNDFLKMNQQTLRATIDFFCSKNEKIEFIWHGGEPLLVGINFFENIVIFQNSWKKKGKEIRNFVQTNGTLLNEDWIKFFKKNDFFIGVSLDSPLEFHESVRLYKNGRNSLSDVLDGIKLLKRENIFSGISCCIGRSNFKKVIEIFDFFDSQDIKSIKFLRIKNCQNSILENEEISQKEFSYFLFEVFKEWIKRDDVDLEIRDIKSVVDVMLGGNFRECTKMGECNQFATVYSDGSIFPCDSFLNKSEFRFGSVFNDFNSVVSSNNFLNFFKKINLKKEECVYCDWFYVCKGGCLEERMSEKKDSDYCKANRFLFRKIFSILSQYGLIQKTKKIQKGGEKHEKRTNKNSS